MSEVKLLPCPVLDVWTQKTQLEKCKTCPNRTAPDWEALAREVEDSGIGDKETVF